MKELTPADLTVRNLGERTIVSPLEIQFGEMGYEHAFFSDDSRVLVDHSLSHLKNLHGAEPACFEVAGPRRKIYFHPRKTTGAIVTCGGLCPGLNDVIRAIVNQSFYRYGVRRIFGIRYGFEGLVESYGHQPYNLTPESVSNIHSFGGTRLGSSRGPQDPAKMVDYLSDLGVNILYVIGGDGSQRGALAIEQEAIRRGMELAVVGVPKTIDNDMIYMDKSFGYETACAAAVTAINAAHTEARSARNGVGLVRLMGRHSGFIACSASIASGDVNCVLIPEVPFELDGEHGVLANLYERVMRRGHSVIIVAEGAGEHLMTGPGGADASGNKKLGDIGVFLKGKIEEYFRSRSTELTLKYIDPSYMIRSVPASPQDRIYCMRLGQAAVHAAMAGKTGIVVGRWHSTYVHLPISLVTSARKQVDPKGDIWLSVLESTGQPARFY
jgi:6-phosphofructokinase 1